MATKKGKRGLGFSLNEVNCLLDAIEEVLPIGGKEWDEVECTHCQSYPDLGRTKESLKRKFVCLYLTRSPTGDPKCPAEVRRAKALYEEIKKKAEISGDDESPREAEEENDDDDDDFFAALNQNKADEIPKQPLGEEPEKVDRRLSEDKKIAPIRIKRRRGIFEEKDNDSSFKEMMKLMMIQRQQAIEDRREEEKARRAEERRYREEEKLRREEERMDAKNAQQMMMMMIMGMHRNTLPTTFAPQPTNMSFPKEASAASSQPTNASFPIEASFPSTTNDDEEDSVASTIGLKANKQYKI